MLFLFTENDFSYLQRRYNIRDFIAETPEEVSINKGEIGG
jgi:hypothetical protein